MAVLMPKRWTKPRKAQEVFHPVFLDSHQHNLIITDFQKESGINDLNWNQADVSYRTDTVFKVNSWSRYPLDLNDRVIIIF